MTEQQLKLLFQSKGYDEKYFDVFKQVWNDEYQDGDFPEQECKENTLKYMDNYIQQLKEGYSQKWAASFANASLYSSIEDRIEQMCENDGRPEDADVIRFAKSFNRGTIFEYAFIEAFKQDILSAPEGMSLYSYATEYTKMYNNILKEGHSGIYAKAYLMVEKYDDYYMVPADIYAETFETAMNKGFNFDDAYDFAGDVCFHDINGCDIIDFALKYFKEYTQDWQQPLILRGLAYALASFNNAKDKAAWANAFINTIGNRTLSVITEPEWKEFDENVQKMSI